MNESLRNYKKYLELQIKETERLMFISKHRHDTVDADKWMAVSEAYTNCYEKLFGEYKDKSNESI